MITKETLAEKREQVSMARAAYQAQIAACDGALKVLDDLAALIESENGDGNG